MTFAIVGGGQLDTGYTIDNSLRFNDGDSPNLNRTFSSSGSRTTWTFSTWIKKTKLADTQFLLGVNSASNPENNGIYLRGDDKIQVDSNDSGNRYYVITSSLFRDASAYYHILVHWNTTDGTASNRFKVYVNGVEQSIGGNSYPPQNYEGQVNRNVSHRVGACTDNSRYFDGYIAETYFIDGQALTPTSFGEFDEDSGIWKPIQYTGTYGTNGFYLDFEDSGSLGADQSGNGNNFTPTNLASTDQTTDTPTNNFATCNPLNGQDPGGDISEGNLILPADASGDIIAPATIGFSNGKWYMEMKSEIDLGTGNRKTVGVYETDSNVQKPRTFTTGYVGCVVDLRVGDVYQDGVDTGTDISTFADNDICSLFYDADNGNLYIAKNGTLLNSGSAINSSALDTTKTYTFYLNQDGGGSNNGKLLCNFGNPPTGFSISSGNADVNGYGNFEYNPVISTTNYLALCTQNLATELSPTIDDGSQYFNTVLYTGNGTNPRSLTGVGFQPDFTWIKNRTDSWGHGLADSTRGGGKTLITNSNTSEQTNYTYGYVDSFDSDGFTVDDGASGDDFVNQTGDAYASWNWLANGGSTSSNADGSITSTVQANTTAGFSIVTYTGTAGNETVGHGLGVAPKVVIIKSRSNSGTSWVFGSDALTDWNYSVELDTSDAEASVPSRFNGTAPTSSVFSIGGSGFTGENGYTYVAYCFAEIEGYSKFGKYTGNGSTNGPFVYTGFRPAFVIYKNSSSATDWRMFDNKRNSFNVIDGRLFPNTNGAENTAQDTVDFLSNGFKLRATNSGDNGSGNTFIYMAFAENPFATSTGVPVPAR